MGESIMENVQFEYFWGGRLEHTLFEGGWEGGEGLLLSSGLYKSAYHLLSLNISSKVNLTKVFYLWRGHFSGKS